MEHSYWTELTSATTHLFVFGSAPKPWSNQLRRRAPGAVVWSRGSGHSNACSQECSVTLAATAPKDTDILDESLTFLSAKWVQWNPLVVLFISPYSTPRE